jgi:hypothetical protein
MLRDYLKKKGGKVEKAKGGKKGSRGRSANGRYLPPLPVDASSVTPDPTPTTEPDDDLEPEDPPAAEPEPTPKPEPEPSTPDKPTTPEPESSAAYAD